MGSTGGIDSILWLNNCYALIDINRIAEAKIKVLLITRVFRVIYVGRNVLNQSYFRQCYLNAMP